MTPYADATFYNDTFKGTTIPNDVLEQRLRDASFDVDSMTYNRITRRGFENLTDFQQERVKMVVCMHADFTHTYGEMLDSPLSGYGAGSTSVSFDRTKVSGQNGIATPIRAFELLKQTGLTVRIL
jgi:hypothetical protein